MVFELGTTSLEWEWDRDIEAYVADVDLGRDELRVYLHSDLIDTDGSKPTAQTSRSVMACSTGSLSS